MIFGIKTKKDREIEELKDEVTFLRCELNTALNEPPIIHRPVNVKPIIARYVVFGNQYTPTSFIRRSLCGQLADYIEHDEDVKVVSEKLPDGDIAYSIEINVVKEK